MRGSCACFSGQVPYGTSRTSCNVACNPVVDFLFLLTFIQRAVCREDQYCNLKPCWLGLSRVVDPSLFLSDPSPDPWTRTESVNPEVRIQIQEASLLRIRPDLRDPIWTVFGHWQKYVFFEIPACMCFFYQHVHRRRNYNLIADDNRIYITFWGHTSHFCPPGSGSNPDTDPVSTDLL